VRARFTTAFRSLHVRNYRLFFAGQLVSLIGLWMQAISQDWLVLRLSDNSPTALGLVTALQFTPILLITLYGGKLADRYDKRVLLLAANVVWTVLALAMGVLVLTGAVTLPIVYVFGLLLGVVGAIETPVRQAFVSELVGNELLPNALSLNATAFNTARILGPAVAGLAVAAFDVGPVFIINGVSYLAALAGLRLMRPGELHRAGLRNHADPPPRIVDGLRYVWRRADLLMPIGLVLVIGLVGFNFQITLAVLAKTVFHTGAAQFGLLSTAHGLGALAGALVSTQRHGRPSAKLVLGAAAAFGVFETLAGFAPTFWLVAALLVPTGFFMILFAQAANQRVQLGTDPSFRGRVMALYVMVFLGTTPVGGPLIGWIAEQFGPRSAIWLGGMLSVVAASVAFAVHTRHRGARIQVQLRPLPRLRVIEPVVPKTDGVTVCVPAVRPAAR
jgi:MFS family permease